MKAKGDLNITSYRNAEESDADEVLSSTALVLTLEIERAARSIAVGTLLTLRVGHQELLCRSVQIQRERKAISSHISQRLPILLIASF